MQQNLQALLPVLGILAAALGGCETELTVEHYPSFYDPSIRTVAVVPFANTTLRDNAGEYLAQRVAESLQANGTYETIGPGELTAKLTEAGLKMPRQAGREDIATALRTLGGVDAFVVGTVRAFSADRASFAEIEHFHPRYGWGYYHGGYYRHRRGYGPYTYGGATVYHYREYTHALVSVDAAVLRVSDGAALYTTPGALTARVQSGDSRYGTRDQTLVQAARAAAERFVGEVAVAPRTVRIDKGKSLRTARAGKRPGELKFTDDFEIDDEALHVVLALPPEADRNEFRLTIAPKGRSAPVAEETIVWSRADDRVQLSFSPRELADAAGGPGKFDVRLHAAGRAVLKRGFEIED